MVGIPTFFWYTDSAGSPELTKGDFKGELTKGDFPFFRAAPQLTVHRNISTVVMVA